MQAGLSRLVVLSLRGTPAFDTLQLAADEWAKALWFGRQWDMVNDPPRIEDAFTKLIATREWWPVPRVLLDELPAKEKPRDWVRPPEKITPEKQASIRAQIANLQHQLDYADQLDAEEAARAAAEIKRRLEAQNAGQGEGS